MPRESLGSPAQRHGITTQMFRFAVVGTLCTLLQYLVLIACVEWGGINPVVASGLGFPLSGAVNYLLNRRFTWASDAAHGVAVRRFIIVVATGLVLNTLGMKLLHGYLHLHYLLAQVLTTMITLLWNFAWHRHWTFAVQPRP
jgi:putative flippase GtrA